MSKRPVYSRVARYYDILDLPFEYGRYRPLRGELFRGLRGRILDAGVGTGRNIPFYPEGAAVVGIDISPEMLERARRRRGQLGRPVELVEMDVRHTSFPDAAFDAVVATFLFCVLENEDQLPALRELARICKPGGEIRVLEYAYSKRPLKRLVMRMWEPWVRFAYGAAFDRNTELHIFDAGLELVAKRFLFQDIIKLLILRPRRDGVRLVPGPTPLAAPVPRRPARDVDPRRGGRQSGSGAWSGSSATALLGGYLWRGRISRFGPG